MTRTLLAAAALVLAANSTQAQTADEQAVAAVVTRVFDGMRAADSAMVRSAFAGGARFASLDGRSTPPRITYDSINGWLGALSRSANRWDEQVYDVQVKVDMNVAQVWAPYTFYLDKKISHCGVNILHLLKLGADWKITQLSDSRKREGCPDPLKTGG